MAFPEGMLPDEVIRDHRAEAMFVFASLRADLDRTGVENWLRRATELVSDLTDPVRGDSVASVAVGLGPTFFVTGTSPRFGLEQKLPVGLASPPLVPGVADPAAAAHDVLFYIMTTSEAAAAWFIEGLSGTRSLGLVRTTVERGFQREDGRELSGFKDGVRNVPGSARRRVAFVNRDLAPDEPHWTEDGTYMAYLKVRQDLDRFNALPVGEQEQIIGRRKPDGSRLDLQAGTDPRTEGEFTAPSPTPNSHVRKTGPRGALHDRTLIFRRGVPYLNLREDGSLDGGLQFVSFQSSLDAFEVMLNKWAFNPDFPTARSGPDRLFAEGYATIEKAGFYFVPPRDDRFIGAGIFDAPPTAGRPRGSGRLVIRKRVIDASGTRVLAEVGGIGFQVFQADTNQPVGEAFTTDSAGHAVSPDVPLNTSLVLREVITPNHLEQMPEQAITVTQKRQLVRLDNRVRPGPAPGYGG